MDLASNVARREANNRKGRNSFVSYTFRQYAKYCDKLIPNYCSWYAFEKAPLYEFAAANEWSIKGYSQKAKPLLYFDFIPFDFDHSEDVKVSFANALAFVEWLEKAGISDDYFTIWLSGSKGFHVEVSPLVFNVETPSSDILRRLKQFSERVIKQLGATVGPSFEIDLTLYSSARLYRVWNTRHAKTGLHKTRIARQDFTAEYVERRAVWAAEPGELPPEFPTEPPAVRLPLPLVEGDARESFLAPELIVDTGLSIINSCPVIKGLMANPEGRELRRQAAGVLMEAYGSPYAPEVEALYEAWETSPHMDETRWADALKWRAEYETDGVIKCAKNCTSFGCRRQQKKICGTQFPSDHLLKIEKLKPISEEEAKELSKDWKETAAYADDANVYVFDEPIGFGKTSGFIKKFADDPNLTALVLAPTHELAGQIATDLAEVGVTTRHIKSRWEVFRTDEAKCPYLQEVRAAAAIGANTSKLVCSKCPRFPANLAEGSEAPPCEFFKQYDKLKEVPVVIGVHQHANPYIYKACGLDDRSFLLIDESPLEAFSNEIKPVSYEAQTVLKAFGNQALDEMLSDLEGVPRAKAGAGDGRSLFGAMRALAAQEEAAAMLDAHAEDATTREARIALVRFVVAAIRSVIGGASLTLEDAELLRDINWHPHYYNFVNRVVELGKFGPAMALKEGYRHLALPNVVDNAITCVITTRQSYVMNEGYYYPAVMPDKKIIILDATASKELYEKMVSASDPTKTKRVIYYKLPYVKQTKARITQLTNSGYSMSRINSDEDVLDRLTFIIKSLRSTFNDASILCVSTLELEEKVIRDIDSSGRTKMLHFGKTRGINEFRDYDFQVTLGGFFAPDSAVIQGLAKLGIYGVTEDLLEANTVLLRNRHIALDGSTYFSQRKAYRVTSKDSPMRYANLILHQRAVSEVVQAIRIRLFYGKPDKNVFVLTNIGLTGVYADRFVTLDDLTNELEELSGLKSDIDESKTKKTALMEARYSRLEVGATFNGADVDKDQKKALNFLSSYVKSGLVKRVKPDTYVKLYELDDPNFVITGPKADKKVVAGRLDAWFDSLPNLYEFTAVEAAEIADSPSVYFVRDWLKKKEADASITAIGGGRSTKYRKVRRMLAAVAKLYGK